MEKNVFLVWSKFIKQMKSLGTERHFKNLLKNDSWPDEQKKSNNIFDLYVDFLS